MNSLYRNSLQKSGHEKSCVFARMCVCVSTCSHGGCETPQGMLLPGSHHVSEGEITPNRHNTYPLTITLQTLGTHRVLSRVFMVLIQSAG